MVRKTQPRWRPSSQPALIYGAQKNSGLAQSCSLCGPRGLSPLSFPSIPASCYTGVTDLRIGLLCKWGRWSVMKPRATGITASREWCSPKWSCIPRASTFAHWVWGQELQAFQFFKGSWKSKGAWNSRGECACVSKSSHCFKMLAQLKNKQWQSVDQIKHVSWLDLICGP